MKENKLSEECWNLWVLLIWFWFGLGILVGLVAWIAPMLSGESLPGLIIIPLGITFFAILSHVYQRAYWRRFYFTYDDHDLRVYSGLWWQKQVLIPFSRITNIDIMQGPWQRSRALATLKIQTAGQSGNTAAETQLWSQRDYNKLREELLMRITRISHASQGDGTGEAVESAQSAETVLPKRMLEVLERIEKNTRPDSK